MRNYKPNKTPEPQKWLSLDEGERIELVENYHLAERIKLPNARSHAVFHAIVENQIAEELQSVVLAMERLAKQGLSRHDCIHAVGWVLAQHLVEIAKSTNQDTPEFFNARYTAEIERLDANSWREQARAK